MEHKIHFSRINGKYYLSIGCKGYKSTSSTTKALSKMVQNKRSGIITYTTDPTEYSLYKAHMNDTFSVMDVYDLKDENLIESVKLCPKLFNDHSIKEKTFYINYNPEW